MEEELILDEKESDEELVLSKKSKRSLDATQKWTLFLSIVLFIYAVWITYSGLNLVLMDNPYGDMMNDFPEAYQRKNPFRTMGTITMILGLIFLFPAVFLLNYSLNSRKALTQTSPRHLENALAQHKYFYMFFGIFVMVIFVFYIAFTLSGANALGLFM